MKLEDTICPKCNAKGTCESIPHLGHVNTAALLFGGALFSLLWSGSRPTRLKCSSCGHRFSRRSRWAKIGFVLFWGIIIGVVLLWMLAPEE